MSVEINNESGYDVDAESLEPSVTDEPAAAGLPVLLVVVAVTVEPFGDLTPGEPQAVLHRPHAAGVEAGGRHAARRSLTKPTKISSSEL